MKAKKPSKATKATALKKGSGRSSALTERQKHFVAEYIADPNATQAAIKAGYSKKTAEVIGYENLNKPQIAAAIAAGRMKIAEKLEITQEMVLKRFWDIATADPNDLIEYRIGCCPDCHKEKGSKFRAPNPECGTCNGDGFGYPVPKDTRHLSEKAKVLYAGVKVTKEGMQVLMHDQLTALTKVGQHLGLFPTKVEMTGKNGGPVEFSDVSDDELDRRLAALDGSRHGK